MIEISPSGRAQCRGCKEKIEKGELRFAETYSIPGTDQEGKRYYHLKCAADKALAGFKDAVDAYEGDIPDKEALLEAFAKGGSKKGGGGAKPAKLPAADRAPTGRAKCIQCSETIEKGAWRVGVEREIDTGTFVTKGAGYLHPACAVEWASENADDPDGFVDQVLGNSNVNEKDAGELRSEMSGE